MKPESMVHAPERIHELLQPAGMLIDIHPAPRPSPVTIHSDGRTTSVGLLHEQDDAVDYEMAEATFRDAVDAGLFRWKAQHEFEQCVVADSPAQLFDHLETKWKRAIVDARLRREIEREWAQAEKSSELVISQPVHIRCLQPLASSIDPE